jgi:hypothetical protein
MAYRCPEYLCEAASVDGLVQQVAVSYLRHGYWWFVNGTIPERKDPLEVDHNILTKYDIRKDWRFIANRKKRGIANLQYIRFGRFYVIMATKGVHEFKVREEKRIRDARLCPILIPLSGAPRESLHRDAGRQSATFEGYAVSYRRGGYLKKSPAEKLDYRSTRDAWREATARGEEQPRPPRGQPDPKWHSRVEIERRSYQRLRAYFLEMAVRHSVGQLILELSQVPYGRWAPVRQQLLRVVKDVNIHRRQAGISDQVSYRLAIHRNRTAVHSFGHSVLPRQQVLHVPKSTDKVKPVTPYRSETEVISGSSVKDCV